MDYLTFFGFSQKPFDQNIPTQNILVTDQLADWKGRFDFVVSHKLWAVLTGDVGAGKSTAIRWATQQLPHAEFKAIPVIASSGTILELYRRILQALSQTPAGFRAQMSKQIIHSLKDIASQNITPILIIDEASLLNLEVFRELHTLTQFECDSKPLFTIILVGQEDLIDKLAFHASKPLASRVSARMHLSAGNLQQTKLYVDHHLKMAGIQKNLFEENALTALHQASAGIPRNINNLARLALMTAASQKRTLITGEDVRVASTELFLHQ